MSPTASSSIGATRDGKRSVLVVEDEPLVRMFLADVLTDEGFTVREAANSAEALAILQACPDVLVMVTDVNMPGGMNGLELARAVHSRWPNISVLIISGRVRPGPTEVPPGSVFVSKPCTALKFIQEVAAAADRAETDRPSGHGAG